MRIAFFWGVCLVLLLDSVCNAQDKAEDWPDTSGMYAQIKADDELGAAEKNMTEVYQSLLERIKKSTSKEIYSKHFFDRERFLLNLESGQKAWAEYSMATCAIEGMSTQAGSSWQGARQIRCQVLMTYQRQSFLEQIVKALDDGYLEDEK